MDGGTWLLEPDEKPTAEKLAKVLGGHFEAGDLLDTGGAAPHHDLLRQLQKSPRELEHLLGGLPLQLANVVDVAGTATELGSVGHVERRATPRNGRLLPAHNTMPFLLSSTSGFAVEPSTNRRTRS